MSSKALTLVMVEFLRWVGATPRTYAETMVAWQSSCPRMSVWEDSRSEGLVVVVPAERLAEAAVVLTRAGCAALEAA